MNSAPDPLQEKRDAVLYAVSRGASERRFCHLVALHRSTFRYEAHRPGGDKALAERIQSLQSEYPRFVVRRVHALLRQRKEENASTKPINHIRVQRVMRIYSLQVVSRKQRKTIRTGANVPQKAEHPNHVWTIDFQEDALIGGRKVRLLNILDEFTRERLAVVVGSKASAQTVMDTLAKLFQERGAPQFLRSDNGGEFVADRLATLLAESGVTAFFIKPGSPWQNSFIESFHSSLRDEQLN